jgi:uncharacterized membrane protein
MAQQSSQMFQTAPDASSDDKLWALLAYVLSPIVPIILLLMEDKKNRPFIKAHAVQALIWGLLIYIVGALTSFIFIGLCIMPVGFLIEIFWGIKAYQGNFVNIPVLTNLVKSQGWA